MLQWALSKPSTLDKIKADVMSPYQYTGIENDHSNASPKICIESTNLFLLLMISTEPLQWYSSVFRIPNIASASLTYLDSFNT